MCHDSCEAKLGGERGLAERGGWAAGRCVVGLNPRGRLSAQEAPLKYEASHAGDRARSDGERAPSKLAQRAPRRRPPAHSKGKGSPLHGQASHSGMSSTSWHRAHELPTCASASSHSLDSAGEMRVQLGRFHPVIHLGLGAPDHAMDHRRHQRKNSPFLYDTLRTVWSAR